MVEEGQSQPEFHLKRIRFEEMRGFEDEDRISRLPDSLLVEILSRLPATKCAVKTGALSKRWKHIWTLVPILIFSHHGQRSRNPNVDFISFVDKTIAQRGQLKLKKLSVYSTYNDRFEPQVRNWIRYAINCNVEEISMYFSNTEHPRQFLLDQYFFMNSYFTNLNLTNFQLNPAGAISWEKLLRLYISHMSLGEDLIENILSGSPVLETLELEECYGYRRLNITSKSVKKLVVDGYMYNTDVIEINAPALLSLAIQAHLYMGKLLLKNVSSLVEADLDYKLCRDIERTLKEAEEEMLKRFILNLRHVKEVKIGTYCFKVLLRLAAKGFIFPSNLKLCHVSFYPFESDDDSELSDEFNSDSDESKDSQLLLLNEGPSGDELQERDDATTSSSWEDDEADA